jgi:hypothetical protein
MDWDKISTIDRAQFLFISITSALFVIIGAFGNIISFIIFKIKLLKNQLSTNYIKGTIVMNIITIFYLPIMLFSPIWIINTVNCKILVGFYVLIVKIQAWITTLSSIDRMISVIKPHDYLYKNKLIFQLSTMIISVIILFILLLPHFIYYDSVTIQNQTTCTYTTEWSRVYQRIEYSLFRAILPFIIMIICSITVTFKMYRAKANISSNANREREKNLFKSLIALDLFFILFRFPMLIFVFINQNENAIFTFPFTIIMALTPISNVFIFIILILFNRVYKQLFIEYMGCKKAIKNGSDLNQVLQAVRISVL